MKFRNRIDNIPIIMYPRKAHVCRASTTQPYKHNRLRLHPPILTLMDRISTKTILSVIFQRNFEIESDNTPIIMYPRKAHVCRASTT